MNNSMLLWYAIHALFLWYTIKPPLFYQEIRKYSSWFRENVWMESVKHEWNECTSVKAPVPTQQGTTCVVPHLVSWVIRLLHTFKPKPFFHLSSTILYSNQNLNDVWQLLDKIRWGPWRSWAPHWRRRWLSGLACGPRQGTGSRSFFSFVASSFTIVVHLQRFTLGKESP